MSRIICPLCEHYRTCKYWETLLDLNNTLDGAVDWFSDKRFNKWRERFARFCNYFRLDEPLLENLILNGLDFIFHDFVYQDSNNSRKVKK